MLPRIVSTGRVRRTLPRDIARLRRNTRIAEDPHGCPQSEAPPVLKNTVGILCALKVKRK